ncbi:MAG: AraC family transcriptional regulator [Anaerolineaceae bacterium]|nr:AraC family transcriptional regulator [Anaerolineaceae bacterium]
MRQIHGLEKARYICSLVAGALRVPIRYYNAEQILEVSHLTFQLPGQREEEPFLRNLFQRRGALGEPVLEFMRASTCYALLPVGKNSISGYYLMGPVVTAQISKEAVVMMATGLNLPLAQIEAAVDPPRSIPRIEYFQFVGMVSMLYYLVFHQRLDPLRLQLVGENGRMTAYQPQVETLNEVAESEYENLPVDDRTFYEQYLLNCVRDGDLDRLRRHLAFFQNWQTGKLAENSTRHYQNLLIMLATLACRAAVEGGLNAGEAYPLCDRYILQAERLGNINEIVQTLQRMVIDFTKRVANAVSVGSYSRPIQKCIAYIFQHLREDISMEVLAEQSGYHRSYLSSKFKKEVGMSIRDYILAQRMADARNLLTYSTLSISEVSAFLSFHSLSYFSTVFKKYYGMSPQVFRDQARMAAV